MYNYDAVISVSQATDDAVNEARSSSLNNTADPRGRVTADKVKLQGTNYYKTIVGYNPDAQYALGPMMRSALQLGNGYFTEISDFGAAVVVRITYMQISTCKSASMTFLVTFNDRNGNGVVYANTRRHRTCTDYTQAVSYIRSFASQLQSRVSGQ